MSGWLAHRGALRSKRIELEHAALQSRDERLAAQRREALDARRSSYAALNQALRNFHAVLHRHYRALAFGQEPPQRQERDEPRNALRDVYAEAQMVVTDEVLGIAGNTFRRLNRIYRLLEGYDRDVPADALLDDVKRRLDDASEKLYEVRQTMRRDLGITALPIERPDGYGAV